MSRMLARVCCLPRSVSLYAQVSERVRECISVLQPCSKAGRGSDVDRGRGSDRLNVGL
ncbi:hypothetical protein M5D96_009592 [Drosophila gunungcola]|uniref:Uncharacterized protein n=1 Tax=Drosophila gunungcola TaxID=103775 RepID=A0A9Q0BMB0_9MUSC|nr:hypothetical protein M5D96_009592 [Drosophila gunungcola]